MVISKEGLEFIKRHEGLRLRAYKPVPTEKHWTIGYGHYGPDVLAGMEIDEEQAEIMLLNDLQDVYDCIDTWVDVDLTQGQYDAICSFIFNLGCGAFKNSTLLRLLNSGNFDGARKQFPRWARAGGKKLAGLVKRRAEEAQMFARRDSPVREANAGFGSCDGPSATGDHLTSLERD